MIETIFAGLTCGIATFYGIGDNFKGKLTSNGEIFNPYKWTAASPYLPMGTRIKVTNQRNKKHVIVRINDRNSPLYSDLDLSYSAFSHIESSKKGRTQICYRVIG